MSHDLLKVVRMNGVEDIEEVLARRPFACRILVWEVASELRVLAELRPECLHGNFIVTGNVDLLDIGLLHKLLLAAEDVLEEVLVDEALRRQVELEAVTKIEVRVMI